MTNDAMGREAAVSAANEAYVSAREYVENIDEESMLRPERVGIWSGKDLVVHIGDWEAIGARILTDLAAGRPEQWLPEGADGNTFNEQRVTAHADKSVEDALAYWQTCHDQLINAYDASGVEREDILLGLTRNHYRGHFPDFRHVKPFKPLSDDERTELLETMDAAHASFVALIDSIDAAALHNENTVGVWSGKDLIAHLGHWQQAAIDLTRELEQDRPGKWPGEDGNNINEWNEARVADMQTESLETIRAYQQDRYDELRELTTTSRYATRAAGIGATEFHYGLHLEDFQALRATGNR